VDERSGGAGRFTADGPAERLNALYDLPIRTDTEPDLDIEFALAERHGLSFYDAVYLELAKRHTAPIATLDKALARAAEAEGLALICAT
jgi:predicted nucleic acid-binding protein